MASAYKEDDDPLLETDFQKVSNNINKEWKALGKYLGINSAMIDAIEYDFNRDGVQEMCFQMLMKWKQMNGRKATKKVLANALKQIGREDLIRLVLPEDRRNAELDEETYNVFLKELQDEMSKKYKEFQLPTDILLADRVLPIEEWYAELDLNAKDKFGRIVSSQTVEVEKIFEPVNGKLPKRLLFEGNPGFGKTTLACRLAFEWTKEDSYIRKKFSLLLIIILRYFNNSFENTLIEQCCSIKFSNSQLLDLIRHKQENVLVIMDGFDELDEESKKHIFPIIKGDRYPAVTILMTSRTGSYYLADAQESLEPIGKNALFLIGVQNRQVSEMFVWDKWFYIRGISEKNRVKFLETYLQKNIIEIDYALSNVISENMKSMYTCPLLLIIAALMVEEGKMTIIKTKTDFFLNLVNLLITRNFARRHVNLDVKIEHASKYTPALLKFGETAFNKLKQKEFTFSKEELDANIDDDAQILISGFMTKIVYLGNNHKFSKRFECIHPSLLEFFSAFYYSQTLISRQLSSQEILEIPNLIADEMTSKKSSLFILFLIGLLKDKAHVLFKALSPLATCFPVTESFFNMIHSEIEVTQENVESLLCFIPPLWKIQPHEFFISPLHESLLALGTRQGVIVTVVWDLNFRAKIPQNMFVKQLCIKITHSVWNSELLINDLNLSCEHLIFENRRMEPFWNIFSELVRYIESHQCDIIITEQHSKRAVDLFYREITEGKWMKKTINTLFIQINPSVATETVKLLRTLLLKNKIQNYLGIHINEGQSWITHEVISSCFTDLLQDVACSDLITTLFWYIKPNCLKENVSFDLSTIFSNNNKKWKYCFIGESIRIHPLETDHNRINALTFFNKRLEEVDDDSHFLLTCQDLQELSVSIRLLDRLGNTQPNWKGFIEITTLEIFVESEFQSSLKLIEKFQNLQVLKLNLQNELLSNNTTQILVDVFCSSRLSTISITINKENYLFLKCLLNMIINKVIKNEDSLSTYKEKSSLLENLCIEFLCDNSQEYDMDSNHVIKEILDAAKRLIIYRKITKLSYAASSEMMINFALEYLTSSSELICKREIQQSPKSLSILHLEDSEQISFTRVS